MLRGVTSIVCDTRVILLLDVIQWAVRVKVRGDAI